MKQLIRFFMGLLVSAFMLVGITANPAMAQDKAKAAKAAPAAKAEKGAPKVTVVMENDKVRVYEAYFKPGDENKAVPSANSRVLRAMKGGTLMRTYADGKTEKREYKTGDVRFIEAEKTDRKSTRLNSSHIQKSRMPSSA